MIHFITSRRWWFLILSVLVLGGAWIIASRVPPSQANAAQIPSPREGFYAPNFTLEDFDGAPLELSSLRGHVVVLNVWASWCAPCRAEMPALQKIYASDKTRGVVILGVNSTVQDSEANARIFAREMDVTFPLLLDRDGAVTSRYLIQALPTTFILDRDGVIRTVVIGGPLSEATLRSKIEPLLAR